MIVHDLVARLASEDPAGLNRLEAWLDGEDVDPERQRPLQREARQRMRDRIAVTKTVCQTR